MKVLKGVILFLMLTGAAVFADDKKKFCHFSFDEEKDISSLKGNGFRYSEEGKFGGSIELDSVNNYVFLDSEVARQLFPGKEESFTIEMWVKPYGISSVKQPLVSSKDNSEKDVWKININSRGRIGISARTEKGNNKVNILAPSDCGKWSHIAFVNDSEEGMLRFYFNNKLIKEENFSGKLKITLPLVLGSEKKEENFQGLVDELLITKGAKRDFNLESATDEDESTDSVYKPAVAVVEKPNPDIEKSWNEIDKYNICIVPCPKKIKITGAVPLDASWSFTVKSEKLSAGIEEINRSIKKLGGKALEVKDSSGGNRIVVGKFEDMKEFLAVIGNPEKPKRQGYIIDFYEKNGKNICVIAGADTEGALYGCVTLSHLLKKDGKIELLKCKVTDWPDYGGRMCFSLRDLDLASCKDAINQAFQSKINIIWGRTAYNTLEEIMKTSAQRKIIYDYAKERGIRVVIGNYFNVADAPLPKDWKGSRSYYPYKADEGLIGSIGKAFTWTRDDLLTERGKLFARFMRESGADTFYLHCMDTGGRFNPENWNNRTPMDIKRWGNDRASADYNMVSRIYSEMKKENPDVTVFAVVYPYVASYLQYPDIKDWLRKLSEKLPEEIFICVREDLRKNMKLWREISAKQDSFVYHSPSCLDCLFSAAGRYAKTFFFQDRDIYWFCSGGCITGIWVASEYSWNTEAPGWGWLPKEFSSIPQVEACPPEISERLLPRIITILYGKETIAEISKILLANLSQMRTGSMKGFYGARPEGFFEAKYHAALEAEKLIAEAEKKLNPEFAGNFSQVKAFIIASRYLTEARYRYYVSRKLLAENKYDEAKEEIEKAKAALLKLGSKNEFAKTILQELDIASAIKWRRELNEYIKLHPIKNNISFGIYTPHNRKAFFKGILEALSNIPGLKVSVFDDITKEIVKKYDVIIFPAADDVGDTTEDWRVNIRKFVENGGGVIFSHNSVGRFPGSAFDKPLFPEICEGFERQHADRTLIVSGEHKALGEFSEGYKFEHAYNDHMDIKAGPEGKTLLTDNEGRAVMFAGSVGKGRVIYTGEIFGLNQKNEEKAPEGDEWKVLFNMILWTSGKN
ncbi:MAG: hypothetical protein A2017_04280 [Lentisphaerae bacterium GWF2_44_16]|nr:MAG: hypothetical protein A2017_04280 [Lentisphaerae bacterium GWF2_44_16]